MGLSPVIPQNAAGWRIDPPVSLPNARILIRDDTLAADPPDDPPGTLLIFQGFLVFMILENSVVDPMANSSRLVFPIMIPPCAFIEEITVASNGGK